MGTVGDVITWWQNMDARELRRHLLLAALSIGIVWVFSRAMR
jgi:hypothetical protein